MKSGKIDFSRRQGALQPFLVRVIVGLIFLSEGLQKFLFPDLLGPGRFETIGFTNPEFWAWFTATFEIVCGSLVLLGMFIPYSAFPLMIIMIVAFYTTKLPIFHDKGFWQFAHEYRTDFSMTVLLIYIIVSGPGRWSVTLR